MTTTSPPRPRRVRRTRGPVASPPSPRRRVLVLSGSVGAGHDGAAHELAARLRASGVDVDVRDYLQALPRWFALVIRDGYALSVARVPVLFEWVFQAIERSRVARAVMRACCRWGDRSVLAWTREHSYDAVVSTYPLASQTLGNLRSDGRLRVPAVTYLTDPAVHRCWVHPAVDLHLTVTEATARQGQDDYGTPMQPAGPLVQARFGHALSPARRALVRRQLGVDDDDLRIALLCAGSLGVGDLDRSATSVLRAGLVPLVLCGRNEALRARLAARPGVLALGWRDDVHVLMQAADVLVHNAGGLSLTEALVAGLPAVSYRCIPGHGVANAAVLDQSGLAPWAHDEAQLEVLLARQAALPRQLWPADDPAQHVLALLEDHAAVLRGAAA